MNEWLRREMSPPELNIIVCVDPRRCRWLDFGGRTGVDLLAELARLAAEQGLADRVQVTPCNCILGCTYGPRIDVARRGSGERVLYGGVAGDVTISIRGRVEMNQMPGELRDLILDNLPAE